VKSEAELAAESLQKENPYNPGLEMAGFELAPISLFAVRVV
jgi:hypothetical protein